MRKKHCIIWMALAFTLLLLFLILVNAFILPLFDVQDGYYNLRFFLPGIMEVNKLDTGMSFTEVQNIMGEPQYPWAGNSSGSNTERWELQFGGILIATFHFNENNQYVLNEWHIIQQMAACGWVVPIILLLTILVEFCIYQVLFHRETITKRRFILWISIVLICVIGFLLFIDMYLLPICDIQEQHIYRIFHPALFRIGVITEGMSYYEVIEILGREQRVDTKDNAREWDLPLGFVFRLQFDENGFAANKSIKPFASLTGFVVPGVLLTVFFVGSTIYQDLFNNKKMLSRPFIKSKKQQPT